MTSRRGGGPGSVPTTHTVADLFSGAGGMSLGFHAHPAFRVVGAADAQVGKPSSPRGSLGCNGAFEANVGVRPLEVDLATADPAELSAAWGVRPGGLDVLSACPPCTGFTRTTAANHIRDDPRNSLVARVADFVRVIRPRVVVMENARELVTGRHRHHLDALTDALTALGYQVSAQVHMLTRFGLPQVRERAVVVAVESGLPLLTLSEAWRDLAVHPGAVTVRRAIGALPAVEPGARGGRDPAHVAPAFRDAVTAARMRAVPADGGSWADLLGDPATAALVIPAHRRLVEAGRLGSHPDVYGRMWWDRPARTIKRECAHVGNGRYAHPEQHRLCTLREMALLQGFPSSYRFGGASLANAYRHVGDAVPPLVSFQLAAVVAWILGGPRPGPADLVLDGTSLRPDDVVDPRVVAA